MFKKIVSTIAGLSAGVVAYKVLSETDADEATVVLGSGVSAGVVASGTGILMDKIENTIKSKANEPETPEAPDNSTEDYVEPEEYSDELLEDVQTTMEIPGALADGYIPEGIPQTETSEISEEFAVQTYEDLNTSPAIPESIPAEDMDYQEITDEVLEEGEIPEGIPQEDIQQTPEESGTDFATQFVNAAESGDEAVDTLMQSIEDYPTTEKIDGSVMDYVSQTSKGSRKHPNDRGERLTRTERRLG